MNVVHTSETSREDFPTVKTGYVHGIERLNERTTLQKEVEIFEILQPYEITSKFAYCDANDRDIS